MSAAMLALIDSGDFRQLFIEHLGWNRPDQQALVVDVDGTSFHLTQVAGYKGVRVWTCPTVPDRRSQRLIDHAIKKISNERLLIFHDAAHQEWRWPQSADSQGRSQPRLVTHQHFVGKQNPALVQRLGMVRLGITEEPTVVELLQRMRRAFDADKVTNAFYKQFLAQHRALVKALLGIADESEREWYSALLLNRLMFIYFMQRKGFMDGDPNYLRTRLDRLQELRGKGHFYDFYRDLLLPLFHSSLGTRQQLVEDDQIRQLMGDVPYINGGIFAVHQLEKQNEISVGDDTFRAIFDLFDAYQWHLDDRPTANQNEINPDVLGYIFEQFINQKEQGAYYTHEDVTRFMTSSTLLPVFLERLESMTGVNPWQRLQAEPDRYIWDGLTHGVEEALPDEVLAEADLTQRPLWGEKAAPSHAHPGETWWEVEHRRATHFSLHESASLGGIADVNRAVTANLDLESLAVDVIDGLDSPGDIVAAWNILSAIKVIDPTCGSGAFLFAALKILQGLYAAVLDSAEAHSGTSQDPALQAILAAVHEHPNREYFVLKHATLSNLYGVDLMHEAVEIARLRLFLKLVAAVDRRDQIEPLPDLDFNIKPGNILVGALDVKDIERQSEGLYASQSLDAVVASAASVADAYRSFREAQETNDDEASSEHRKALQDKLSEVRADVNGQFFTAQGLTGSQAEWVSSHQPFHWFLEFPDVFESGGFDVVIGNPPYINKRKLTAYDFEGFSTDDCPDIYAPCCERAGQITSPSGRYSLIIPISAQFSADFEALRSVLAKRFPRLWVSAFSRNPAALFSAGLGVRSTIVVGAAGDGPGRVFVTKTHRWIEQYRPALFEALTYTELPATVSAAAGCWTRSTNSSTTTIMADLLAASPNRLHTSVRRSGIHQVGLKSIGLYWISCYDHEPPSYTLEGQAIPHTAVRGIAFEDERMRDAALAVMASKLMLMWWACNGDDFNVTGGLLTRLPVDLHVLPHATVDALSEVGRELSAALDDHVQYTKYDGKWMGNYVLPELREITDRADLLIAEAFGYRDRLPDLEHFYWSFYKPTGERPGTLRESPFA